MTRTPRRALAPAALAVVLFASAAHAAILTATDNNSAYVAVQTAKPGDTVQLQNGFNDVLDLWGLQQASPGVTIAAAPNATVTVTAIDVSGSSGLTFSGLNVAMTPTTQYGVTIANGAHDIILDGLTVHQADNATPVDTGIYMRNLAVGSNVVVRNSDIGWVGVGANLVNVQNVLVTNTTFHDINVDGIDCAGCVHTQLTYDSFTNFHPGDGDHPDAIQFFADNNDGPTPIATSYLTVDHVRIEQGTGSQFQGVFGGPGDHLVVTNSVVRGTMTNGLAAADTTFLLYEHDFLQAYPPPSIGTAMEVRGASDQVFILGNALAAISIGYSGDSAQPTNVTQSGNTVTPVMASTTDDTALNAWLAAGGDVPVTAETYAWPTAASAPAPMPTPAPAPAPTPTPVPAADPLQPQLDAATAEIAQQAATIAADQQQIATVTNQLQVANAATATAQAADAADKAQAATLAGQVQTLTAQVQTVTTAQQASAAQLTALQGQAATLQGQLTVLQASTTAAQVKSLQQQLQTAQASLAAAQKKIANAQAALK